MRVCTWSKYINTCILLFNALGLLGCYSTRPQPTVDSASRLNLSLEPSRTSEAAIAFVEVATKYAHCRTYRDRGTVVGTSWDRDGFAYSSVERFDTLFIRNRGLRFRYFDEAGNLLYGIRARGDDVEEWSGGSVSALKQPPGTSVEYAMSSLKGVTGLASWVVFKLLIGLPPIPRPTCGPLYAGAVACAKCPDVAFHCPSQGSAAIYTLDLRTEVLRRFKWLTESLATGVDAREPEADPLIAKLPGSGAAEAHERHGISKRTQTLILYDSVEFDSDEGAMAAELDKP